MSVKWHNFNCISIYHLIRNDRVLTALVGVLFASINTYQRIIFIIFAKMIFLVENLLVSRDSIPVFYLSKTISSVTWFPTSVWNEILVFSVTLILLTTKFQEHIIENEVAILRRVNHPNIILLVEEFDTKDSLYLVMEYVKVKSRRVCTSR